MPLTAGRVCPLAYRYRSSAVRAAAVHAARSAYVVGGLYGNTEALDAVLGLADAEQQATGQRPLLVFNGDWNWFNTGHAELLHVNRVIREECEMGRAVATAGNIEMELGVAQASLDRGAASAAPADAGCGCAYPEYVDGGVVARSNQLMERLQRQLCRGDGGEREMAEVGRWLAGLPLFTRLEVGGQRVAVLHGDAQSLAGWSFAAEAMVPPDAALLRALGVWPPADKDGDGDAVQSEVAAGGGEVVGRGGWKPTPHTEVADAFEALAADVIACTHTCLPFAQQFRWTRRDGDGGGGGGGGGGGTASVGAARRGVLANNGSAGMPNFSGVGGQGLITRIATEPCCRVQQLRRMYGVTLKYPENDDRGADRRHQKHVEEVEGEAVCHVDAVALPFDRARWEDAFLREHAPGSPAYVSYWARIRDGPSMWSVAQADRTSLPLG
jgi:hypothetical protein